MKYQHCSVSGADWTQDLLRNSNPHPLCKTEQCWHITYTSCYVVGIISRFHIISDITDITQISIMLHCLRNNKTKRSGQFWVQFFRLVNGTLRCRTFLISRAISMNSRQSDVWCTYTCIKNGSTEPRQKKNHSITWLRRKDNLTVLFSHQALFQSLEGKNKWVTVWQREGTTRKIQKWSDTLLLYPSLTS